MGISSIVFIVLLLLAGAVFGRNLGRIISNIRLGRKLKRNDKPAERWMLMAKVAMGQSKMAARPVAGLMHLFVYVGFVIINIEILEIIIDGILGTHRVFSPYLGIDLYHFVINVFEVLALLVIVGCVVFLIRRNVLRLKRFHKREMTSWPTIDANVILVFEILLMGAFLTMNAADSVLMYFSTITDLPPGLEHYTNPASKDGFLVSQYLTGFLPDDPHQLAFIERFCWWFHIVGIFIFLNYIPYSKHFHILMAFPNVWYSNLKPKGRFTNIEAVTNEVKLMLDPSADPYAAPTADAGEVEKFGAKDVTDLTWKNLMDAYTCTECGRCTAECPANQTGKLLSPRKIMMDTRDRLEEIAAGKRKNGTDFEDGKSLLRDYITEEELWACTTCNACVEACPVNIDPLNIIVDLRRFLIMEESKSPESITAMFNNVENNGAPWAFSQADRANWINEN
jgi:heterodisulfide reductase subunit C